MKPDDSTCSLSSLQLTLQECSRMKEQEKGTDFWAGQEERKQDLE